MKSKKNGHKCFHGISTNLGKNVSVLAVKSAALPTPNPPVPKLRVEIFGNGVLTGFPLDMDVIMLADLIPFTPPPPQPPPPPLMAEMPTRPPETS